MTNTVDIVMETDQIKPKKKMGPGHHIENIEKIAWVSET